MAKSINVYTRGLKQRLGGVVWYQRGGQTLARELAPNVSNPRTEAQMDQRIKMANVVAVYRANKAWMERYAFENRKQGLSVYNAFVAANLSANQVALTKEEVELGAGVVAPYVFTKGTLPAIGVQLGTIGGGPYFITDIYIGSTLADQTIGALSSAIIENNFGWQKGDQLSIIYNTQKSAEGTPYISAAAFEIIIDPEDTTPLGIEIAENDFLAFDALNNTGDITTGIAVVHSRDVANGVAVSPSRMVLNNDVGQSDYTGEAARSRARRSYGPGQSEPFLAGGYYEGGEQPEPSPSSPAIQSVKLGSGQAQEAGGVISVTPAAGLQTMLVTFASDIDSEIEVSNVETEQKNSSGAGPTVVMGQYSVSDNVLTCTGIFSSDNNISKVIVNFSNGDERTISFTPTVSE